MMDQNSRLAEPLDAKAVMLNAIVASAVESARRRKATGWLTTASS